MGAEDGAEALVEGGGGGAVCAREFAEKSAVGRASLVGELLCHFERERLRGWVWVLAGYDWDLDFGFWVEMIDRVHVIVGLCSHGSYNFGVEEGNPADQVDVDFFKSLFVVH